MPAYRVLSCKTAWNIARRYKSTQPMANIALLPEEDAFIRSLDTFSQVLHQKDNRQVELRIAGGWVRDKLLGLPSDDLDVAISSMTGYAFAQKYAQWMDSQPKELAGDLSAPKGKATTVGCIAANPDQSKHLETATANFFNRDIDFVQLRNEEYGSESRIPTEVIFGTPLQDALRRDITINALFYNVHSRKVEDWTEKGLDDLLTRPLIRCPLPPHQTFIDDPLRILRCIRFASRFDYPLDQEVVDTIRLPDIKKALASKVSKERVLKETEKMLQHKNAYKAVQLIHSLDLYEFLFAPKTQTSPANSGEYAAASLRMARMVHFATDAGQANSSDNPLSTVHPILRDNPELQVAEVRKRLYLASQLVSLRDVTHFEKKKKVWLGDKVLRENLSASNHDRQFVERLFKAGDIVGDPVLSAFSQPSERVALGLMMRNASVNDVPVGPTWKVSLLFSLLIRIEPELAINNTSAVHNIINTYNTLLDRILTLNLPRDAFDKPRINGNDITSIIGYNAGKETATLLNKVVEWQLEYPQTTREDCLACSKQKMKSLFSNDDVMPDLLPLLLSVAARVAFIAASRQFVKQTLYADLQSVIVEDDHDAGYELAQANTPKRSRPQLPLYKSSEKPATNNNGILPKLAVAAFAATFSECCVLCGLVLFGNIIPEQARWYNWTTSTGALLAIVTVVAPLGQCVMTTHAKKKATNAFSITLTLFLFAIYEVILNLGGQWLSTVVGISAGSKGFGPLNTAMARICVPGVLLIAILSGAGAVNTTWSAFEWRELFSGRPVTDSALRSTEISLSKAREDLLDRRSQLDALAISTPSSNFFTKMITSNSDETKRNMLQAEIRGLQSLEAQMIQELNSMRTRQRTFELQGTFKGRLFKFVGWLFTAYCVIRVFLAALNLILGLDRTGPQRVNASDAVGKLLGGIAAVAGLDINVTTWTHLIGLGLIGTIIMVNMRTVVASVSRVLRASSAGVSASFLLLFLAQLMAIYILTFLISLPTTDDQQTEALLATLPDFAVFARLFDAAFLGAALAWAVLKFVDRKIRADDYSPL